MTDRIVIPGTNKTLTEPMLANMGKQELLSFMKRSSDPFIQHLIARLDGSFYASHQQPRHGSPRYVRQ